MARLLSFLTALMLLAVPAGAQEKIVAGLSQNRVSITATFVGSEILIFGAVKRETPAPESKLGVVIVVEGPSHPVTVRRKERRFGIWVNADAVEFQKAPSFYAVASSAPFDELISPAEDHLRHISIPEAIRIFNSEAVTDPENFAAAVVRIRKDDGLFTTDTSGVYIAQDTLFDTRISLPANLVEGQYKARIFLTRNKEIIAEHITYIDVRKVGLERWLYSLAHEQPLLYGLMSLAIAIAAGWGASAFFRIVLRN